MKNPGTSFWLYSRQISLLLLFWLISIPLVNAQDTLRVGVYQNEPKIFQDNNGVAKGIYVDILNEIARLENWTINYQLKTWEGCLAALENGTIDLLPDVAFSVERSEDMCFNKISVLQSWSQIYTRKKFNINELSDLENLRIAVLDRSVQQAGLKELMHGYGFTFTEMPVSSMEEALLAVKMGLADAAVANHFFGRTHAAEYKLMPAPLIFNPANLHFSAKKGMLSDHLQLIDQYLADWKKTPHSLYYQSLQKYLPMDPKSAHPSFHWKYLLGTLVLIGIGLVIIYFLRKKLHLQSKHLTSSTQQLMDEEEKFRSYIEHAPFGIFVANEQGQYIDVNDRAEELTGYTKKDLLNKQVKDLIPADYHEQAAAHFGQVVSTGQASGVFPYQTRSGDIRYWTVQAVKLTSKKMLGFVFDVTEQQKTQQELERLKEELESQVAEKTQELQTRIRDLEHFQEVTVEREIRMNELVKEIEKLKKGQG